MDRDQRDRLEDLAKAYGIDLATSVGLAFLIWLSKRPRIAKFPRLARFLYTVAGGR